MGIGRLGVLKMGHHLNIKLVGHIQNAQTGHDGAAVKTGCAKGDFFARVGSFRVVDHLHVVNVTVGPGVDEHGELGRTQAVNAQTRCPCRRSGRGRHCPH